jgi:hypothetical protein
MAIIALPASVRIARAQWTLDRPAQINRGAYTGRRQVVANPWHGRWTASVSLAPIIGEANARAWRAFLAKAKGQINTFRLPMTEGSQSSLVTGVVSSTSVAYTAGAGATTMLVAVPGGTTGGMLAGMFVTVNDQPLLLTADAVLDPGTGNILIQFEPPLRAAVTLGTAIETRNPTCLVAMADSASGWSVEKGQVYGFEFTAEEAF